jgi:hypothetical protein
VKSVQACLSFSLLLVVLSSSLAQAPQPQPAQQEAKAPSLQDAKPLKEGAKDDELRKLQKARYNEALAEFQLVCDLYRFARVQDEPVVEAAQRLVRAGLEVYDKPADKIALLTEYLKITTVAEQHAHAHFKSAKTNMVPVHKARYQRLDAEIQLLRAKRETEKATGK